MPYLKAFAQLNPTALCLHECDDSNRLTRVFVCPGIMSDSLLHVRPVISVDAAHMKTTGGGGILYMASVKSACDDIYPVAIALTVENENKEGWVWFLENLQCSLPVLDSAHPNERVAYKRFTFISDRQKGLIEALKEVFPSNHSCYCAVHIARNVEAKFGAKQAKYVVQLAKTFSTRYAEELLAVMGQPTRRYIEEIEPSQWRSAAWINDEMLPPRYGIVTSNLSESTNAMFEAARDVPWMTCLDMILSRMVERIGKLREMYKDRSGVVYSVIRILEHSGQHCAGMSIVDLNHATKEVYAVFVAGREGRTTFNLCVDLECCDCGLWQEHGYPCIHAVAVFKKHREFSFEQLLTLVKPVHTYENENNLFQRNFRTVCMDQIAPDKTILSPVFKKRKAGRPKKKRIRKRARYSSRNSPLSNLRCSRCGVAGHNVRTCLARHGEGENLNELLEDQEDAAAKLDRVIPDVDLL